MTPAQGRQWRRELMRQIKREHAKEARAKLLELVRTIAEAKAGRRAALHDAKRRCREERVAARVRIREMRRRALLELREATKRERQLARSQCSADLAAAREIAGKVARARAELLAERTYRRDLKRIEQGNRARSLEMKRATRAERGGESDDEVRQNLSPEYLNLWERVKSRIRGSARMTRTEVFLHYAEEHPGELLEGIEEKTDAMIREYQARARSTKRELRRGPPRELVARRIAQEAERRAAAGGEVPF